MQPIMNHASTRLGIPYGVNLTSDPWARAARHCVAARSMAMSQPMKSRCKASSATKVSPGGFGHERVAVGEPGAAAGAVCA
jgi:hypothetical protein